MRPKESEQAIDEFLLASIALISFEEFKYSGFIIDDHFYLQNDKGVNYRMDTRYASLGNLSA